jgi:predicted MPP superfamily phosphohydrolase
MSSDVSRRDFLKIIKFFGGAALTTLASNYYATEYEPSNLEVSRVEIPLGSLPKAFDGFRILQISDIHIGGWMNRERLSRVVDLALQQQVDLVVTTGDYVIGHAWTFELDLAAADFIELMAPLTQTYQTVGVMGNHDYWTDPVRARDMLARAGILELRNDVHRINRNGESLYIAGLDDISEGKHDLDLLRSRLPTGAHTILLTHEPDYARVTSETGKFLLQLSGHSHGGQVVIPFLGPPVLPHWARRYPAGLYQLGQMFLYTSRGVGMTSPFVRFNCRPEIAVFTLNSTETGT